jgi:predicted aspartyl protease
MRSFTEFDPQQRYIMLQICVADKNEKTRDFLALLDTGAPATEFSDDVLQYLGFLESTNQQVTLQHGMQTQKYGQTVLPHVEICSHSIKNLKVYVSHFEKSWGIDALIGLDFFRQLRVTIDYKAGQIITEPYEE